MRQLWKPIRTRTNEVRIRSRGYLPHWEREGSTYSITTRLNDSLPLEIFERIRSEYLSRVERERLNGKLTAVRKSELELEYSLKIDESLDRGLGSCILADPRVGEMVMNAIHYFRGDRYAIHAACVMPNHMHLVLEPYECHDLSQIMHSLKRFTSAEANRILGKTGRNWQPEYYDRIIRSGSDFERTVRYVLGNPAKGGLGSNWPWIWPRVPDETEVAG